MVKAARQRENTKEKRVISSKKAASNELLIRRSLVRVQQGEPKDQSFMDWSFSFSGRPPSQPISGVAFHAFLFRTRTVE